ncbi:MAG: hypothetical protein WHT63_05440 [Tepidiforma sp.]
MTVGVREGAQGRGVPTIGVMLRRWRTWGTRRRVEELIRGGVGVSERAWRASPGRDAAGLAAEVAAWAREEMAGMRRPFGVDQVALALAWRDGRGRVFCSASLGVMRPGAFYDGTAEQRLAEAFAGALGLAEGREAEVLAALVRLGDLAFELQGAARAA